MRQVVVVGGGFVGAEVARELQDRFKVTLIDRKPYFEFTPGVLRAVVEPEVVSHLRVMHDHYLHNGTIIRGEAESFDAKSVTVNRRKIPYDYLVMATGAHYRRVLGREVIASYDADTLAKSHARLKRAKRVLVIGGGLVGIELAAEIASRFPEKKVTLVHSRERLMDRDTPRAGRYAERWLQRGGVELILGERVMSKKGKRFMTKSHRKVDADIAFLAIGTMPNCDAVACSLPEDINKAKQVMVDGHLRLKGYSKVFAGGDLTDIKEIKLAQNAEYHAKVIAENIRRMDRKRKLVSYSPKQRAVVVSLGKRSGILMYKRFTLTGLIPGILKRFVEWKTMRKFR